MYAIRRSPSMSGNSWAKVAASGLPPSQSIKHIVHYESTLHLNSAQKSFSTHASSEPSPMSHRGQEQKDPLIVSLRFNKKVLDTLTIIRQRHFPPHNNNLEAHLTILHALPAECRQDMQHYLQDLAQEQTNFRLSLGRVQVKPRIVLLPVRGDALNTVVDKIQQKFWEKLSDQDRSSFRQGHITLCNKRPEEEIADRGAEIENDLRGCDRWHCMALGLDLWVYQGKKPWKHVSYHQFTEHGK